MLNPSGTPTAMVGRASRRETGTPTAWPAGRRAAPREYPLPGRPGCCAVRIKMSSEFVCWLAECYPTRAWFTLGVCVPGGSGSARVISCSPPSSTALRLAPAVQVGKPAASTQDVVVAPPPAKVRCPFTKVVAAPPPNPQLRHRFKSKVERRKAGRVHSARRSRTASSTATPAPTCRRRRGG